MKICKKCGAKAGDGVRFCPMCGEKFPPDMPKSWKEASVPVRKGNLVTFGIYPQSAKAKSVKLERTETLPFGSAIEDKFNKYPLWRGDDGEYYTGSSSDIYSGEEFKYEPIVWRVIREEGKKLLLLSDKILDTCGHIVGYRFDCSYGVRYYTKNLKVYDQGWRNDVWVFYSEEEMGKSAYEESDARGWLNGKFLNSAFSPEAQKYILTAKVDNSARSMGDKDNFLAGASTRDKIFLLSYSEAAQTLGLTDASRKRKRTDFAAYYRDIGDDCSWILRSPSGVPGVKTEKCVEGSPMESALIRNGYRETGSSPFGWWHACMVREDGTVFRPTYDTIEYAVPAMWIQMP